MEFKGAGSSVNLKTSAASRDLRPRLHRHLINRIEQDGVDIAEWQRPNVALYVSEKTHQFVQEQRLAVSRYELDRLVEEMVDELAGFGPIQSLLHDNRVSEILVNGAQQIFVEINGKLQKTDLEFVDDEHVIRVIRRMLAPVGRRIDEASPMVDARLRDGSRINAIIPPLSLEGPCLSVRKFNKELLRATDLLVQRSLDDDLLQLLQEAVQRRCNIMISGGTGTGKTTLLNILSNFIRKNERVVTIEDTAELQLGHDHVVRLETRPANIEGQGSITSRQLLRNVLRMRPDRIVLGEVRGDEVLDVLQAMNTGHSGSMTTIHANSADDALLRLEMLVGLSGHIIQEHTLRQMVSAALDLIVQVTRLPSGRRVVSQVLEVAGLRDGMYVTTPLYTYDEHTDRFVASKVMPGSPKLRALFRETVLRQSAGAGGR